MSHKSAFQILDRQDLIKIGFQDIYFISELRLRKGKKMRRRQGSGFENLLDHLFSFYSLLQVLKRKWEEDEEAALMNAKCLFPSNSLWWWILCPKDRSFSAIQIPLRPQQKMKVTMKQIIHFNEIRPSIFGTHFEPSTDVLLCCVRKIEEKEWESYFDGVAAAALFHQTCRSHFSHPIYRILNFTPARTLNNWAKGKSHLFSLPIYSSISNLWSKIADEKGLSKVPPSKLFPQHKENGKEETRRAVCIQHFFNLLFTKVKAFSKAIYDRDSREHQLQTHVFSQIFDVQLFK